MSDQDRRGRAGAARERSSEWGSEESRDFLQERLRRYSGLVLFVSSFFFVAGWAIAFTWDPIELAGGLPLTKGHLLNLGAIAVMAIMWLATRGPSLPGTVLQTLDAVGTVLLCVVELFMCFAFEVWLRPDLLAAITLFVLLMYRAAIVPSTPARTAWIGVFASAPLPVLTYAAYEGSMRPELPSPVAYTMYALLFGALAVLISTKISSVIYGLRQTVREARRLGPYTLDALIGKGGMGAVYRASHALLRRPTAIKILPPERAGQMDLARFEREVQLTALLTSPHTVSVYDYGRTPDGLFYYAMEYLDGIDLEDLVRSEGPMPPARVVHVLIQVCDALGEAHRAGLIHRDIKPANILLCERGGRADMAKVVDFGLVKDVAAKDSRLTQQDIAVGTPHYMAPEALQSPDAIDARSDIYALGATAYFMLTGSPVFGGTIGEVFAKLLQEKPEPPSKRAGRPIPAELESLLLAALAKSPEDRPESIEVFHAALVRCAADGPWTPAEAAAWWRKRGRQLKAARSGAAPTESAGPRTLDVAREPAPPA